eukprot:m.186449 g.186449  ORF g.186449 m.186449 type:complete len:334 (+) comp32268_c2_seq2:286-1287(+)
MHLSESFTSSAALNALVGGLGIGMVVSVYTKANGKKMSSSTLNYETHSGLILTTLAYALFTNGLSKGSYTSMFEAGLISLPLARIVLAGLLTGAGAKFGGGCTSGNGIQGIAALSPASLVFTVAFMVSGAVVSATTGSPLLTESRAETSFLWELALAASLMLGAQHFVSTHSQMIANVFAGGSFALFLMLSSMVKPSKVIRFLDFSNEEYGWDPSLAFVMGGALLVTGLAYRVLMHDDNKTGSDHAIKTHKSLSQFAARPAEFNILLGGLLFGAGWGLTGICPGPGFINGVYFASYGLPQAALWGASMFGGKQVAGQIMNLYTPTCDIGTKTK